MKAHRGHFRVLILVVAWGVIAWLAVATLTPGAPADAQGASSLRSHS